MSVYGTIGPLVQFLRLFFSITWKVQNRFDLLAKGHETKSTETLTSKNNFISGLKFSSININSIHKRQKT